MSYQAHKINKREDAEEKEKERKRIQFKQQTNSML